MIFRAERKFLHCRLKRAKNHSQDAALNDFFELYHKDDFDLLLRQLVLKIFPLQCVQNRMKMVEKYLVG